MTKSQVMSQLKENRNERGIANWTKRKINTGGLKSFGIGLTQLRKLAKQIGRDHELALKLWASDNHDAKVVSLLIDDPQKLTREQVEKQVEEIAAGHLAHVFSACDATLAKAPIAFELACDWMKNKDPIRRRCGYSLIYELSKKRRTKELTHEFLLSVIDQIRNRFESEDTWERMAMAGALVGMGKRNKTLNKEALKVAKKMGPIDFNEGTGNCDPFDPVKHLTSDYLKKKLGLN
ncbi:MAG: hypothetical protein HOH94_10995 [Verrucomicrobia bacterium]|jgi:3-methyladenine DNA glycosylase AlkD|nr:hypothetical protein [Verrucomicrobiota bacterium]MDB4659086.1 DNA alkylation repair protein [bacterium]